MKSVFLAGCLGLLKELYSKAFFKRFSKPFMCNSMWNGMWLSGQTAGFSPRTLVSAHSKTKDTSQSLPV